ncbi:Subtilisin-like protease [Actinidia chinensis var. chinensis]|uniref:Subtilisin-like protease n=1 Tax=Actinidia chinensis var. chinensis TaxID=1590841 RepID=A0A2R6PYN9_ACTCC|nr:Subtilisin-like protease [Actinidia chinensis var. chinensis]
MASTMKKTPTFFLLSLLLLLPLLASCAKRQVYIVYFGEHSGEKTLDEIEETHHSYLFSVKETEEEARSSLLYSYKNSINGFAAVLTADEASKLSELEEVVSVFRSEPSKYSLQTTRSWEFVGLDEGEKWNHMKRDDLLLKARYGKQVIVGLLDNGVWPESRSFRDEGMGHIPKSWKGICQSGDSFNSSNCNRKLIGARYYLKGYEQYYGPLNTSLDYRSPRDKDGHGTHTSSTVGGRRVHNASALGGFARGTASGGAPLVHLAIYKVCWAIPGQGKEEGNTCFAEDMLAAIDDAIGDGVHVLSISIGTYEPTFYTEDGISIGALHAIKKNIVVACSAGNSGPAPSTLSNPAPWIITVGASSVDRAFVASLLLGNGMKIEGQTVTPYKLEEKMYPLVYAAQVVGPNVPKNDTAGQCLPGSLSPEKAKGKIVMCLRGNGSRVGKGEEVRRAGGIGFILGNSPANGAELTADAHVLPATAVASDSAIKILKYINSTKKPMAYISPARTVLDRKPAPFMASFTSRGPNTITPDILKPDITGPGLNILAAWSGASSPTKLADDKRVVEYNILSGTSMSCPHVGAAAALLKAIHPTWTSAAIRSALITSAGLNNNLGKPITDASGHPATPFQYGSGHLRPSKAADPGLVYDASYSEYLLFLCYHGVTKFDPSFKCPKSPPTPNNLNYPSLAISKLNGTVTVKRTVTNVGGGGKSVYFSSVKPPIGFSVKVSPPILFFHHVGQKKSFTITVKAETEAETTIGKDEYAFGWLTWSDGVHIVRSPMAVSLA